MLVLLAFLAFGLVALATLFLGLRLLAPDWWIDFVNLVRDVSFKQMWTDGGVDWSSTSSEEGDRFIATVHITAKVIVHPVRLRAVCSIPADRIRAEAWREGRQGPTVMRGLSFRSFRNTVELVFYAPPLDMGESLDLVLEASERFTVDRIERAH